MISIPSAQKKPSVYWIGDSTVQFNHMDTWPQCGMGQVLDLYLRPGITVHDHAKNGRSAKSFRAEGLWEPVYRALQPGDLLLIQFGHNDEKEYDPARYAAPEEFARLLLDYARLAKEKGAHPVLVTPLTRRHLLPNGKLENSHGVYPDTVRMLAVREKLPLIDLTAASRALVESLPEEKSREFYMVFPAGVYDNYPEGKEDNTHLRYLGAVKFCGLLVDGLKALGGVYADFLLQGPIADKYDGKQYEK